MLSRSEYVINLYSSPNIVRFISPFIRFFKFFKCKQLALGDIWEKENTMRLKELCCAGVGWIHLAQKTDWWLVFVNPEMNLWVP